MSESTSRTSRRMRLGTRSCAECRRRRVRCVFPPRSQVCQACAAHGTSCRAQQPSAIAQGVDIRQRLQNLEGLVTQICQAADLNMEKISLSEFETGMREALNRLQQAPISNVPRGSSHSLPAQISVRDVGSIKFSRDASQDRLTEDAPLLDLFKEAMLMEQYDNPIQEGNPDAYVYQNLTIEVKRIKLLLPEADDMNRILELTQCYWYLWPIPTMESGSKLDQDVPGSLELARNFIYDSLRSNKPNLIAKAILWFALCTQQLPKQFEIHKMEPPFSGNDAVDLYVGCAERLLSLQNEDDYDSLECSMLQWKLDVNAGRPRKAWLRVRRGINCAMLLGCHHISSDQNEEQKAIWAHLWQMDRHLSLTLGFPYIISGSHSSLSKEYAGSSTLSHAMYDLGIIAGHIIDRNQGYQTVGYPLTVQIDQELEECISSIPTEWLKPSGPETPFKILYTRQVFKLFYNQLRKVLHLPYMLKASRDRKFEHSKVLALEASREMIRSYQLIRENSGPIPILCDLLDYQVFSAAIVLVITLLSKPRQEIPSNMRDWELVSSLSATFKKVTGIIDCAVARQGAAVLDHLFAASTGAYSGPEDFAVMIPYFGKMKIRRFGSLAPSYWSNASSSAGIKESELSAGSVEFSASSSDLFGQVSASNILSDLELSTDWMSAYSDSTTDDWHQIFDMEASTWS